jgi:hypothetical protein
VLDGGPGPGRDYVWAFYGRGTIDCGPGANDTARVRLKTGWKVRNCERIVHFCGHGSDGHGGCLKPGEKPKGRTAAPSRAASASASRSAGQGNKGNEPGRRRGSARGPVCVRLRTHRCTY